MKRFALLALLAVLAPAQTGDSWLAAFDDVVDQARALHIEGLEDSLTALRLCALANESAKCGAILKPILEGVPENVRARRLSGEKKK